MEENKGSDTFIKVVEGEQINRGFLSKFFINNTEQEECVLINPIVYSHKGNISNIKDILPQLEKAVSNNRAILILTEGIEPEVLDTIVMNKVQNHLKVCVVKVPFEKLMDITECEKATIDSRTTTIIAPNTKARVAVIYVGAASEVEMKEKKDRFDDALHATRAAVEEVKAAIEEGIVPGGGWTYLNASKLLDRGIIKSALLAPLKAILKNAGKDSDAIIECLLSNPEYGYDAKDSVYCNLLKEGIIDPAKVARTALENAASVAGMFLTTECVIADKKEENPMPMPPMGGGMGGMM